MCRQINRCVNRQIDICVDRQIHRCVDRLIDNVQSKVFLSMHEFKVIIKRQINRAIKRILINRWIKECFQRRGYIALLLDKQIDEKIQR